MRNFGDALRAGWQAARDDYTERRERPAGSRFTAGGVVVRCTHCGGERFDAREALLNTTIMTFLDMDWLDRSATVLVCVQCAAMRWFAAAPTAAD